MNDKTHNQRMAMIMEEKFAGYYKDYNHIQNLLKSFADNRGEVIQNFHVRIRLACIGRRTIGRMNNRARTIGCVAKILK